MKFTRVTAPESSSELLNVFIYITLQNYLKSEKITELYCNVREELTHADLIGFAGGTLHIFDEIL